MSDSKRPGMPPHGHYAHFGKCEDDCDSYAELRLLRELVAYPRSKFEPLLGRGAVAETPSGVLLWQQYRVFDFRADFALTSTKTTARLLIEVDGAEFHGNDYDNSRDAAGRKHGYETVRVPARDVVAAGMARTTVDMIMNRFASLQRAAKSHYQAALDRKAALKSSIASLTGEELVDYAIAQKFEWSDADTEAPHLHAFGAEGDKRDVANAIKEQTSAVLPGVIARLLVLKPARDAARKELDDVTARLLAEIGVFE